MNRSAILIVITILALLGSVVIIIGKKIPPEELHLLFTQGVVPNSLIKGEARRPRQINPRLGGGTVETVKAEPVERTDEELNKVLAELPLLNEIPWQRSEIAGMFSNRRARPCQLLPPESPIEPMLALPTDVEGKLVSQRSTAFLIGLAMDPKARGSLPSLSKATIENYLAQNSLAIQPEICRNREGDFLFTGMVHAAFFAKSRPSITGSPEPMIGDAVKSFRILGVLPPVSAGQDEVALPRTLVMAFSYVRDKNLAMSLTASAQEEYELIFLHLLPQNDPSLTPSLAVFTTTDGCSVFQELDLSTQTTGRGDPAVMASIRFDDFKLMGLYPANPIVTGLSNKIRGSLTVEELRNRIDGRAGASAVSLEKILDDLHNGPEFAKVTKVTSTP